MKIVTPKVYLIGSTKFDKEGLLEYLDETGNSSFADILTGVDEMDIVSFYGKLCYKSLSVGHNKNISKTREIRENFISLIESGHGSVLESSFINFVVENVSRVFHTELVRHRAGTHYSMESGRYCFSGELNTWVPSIFENNPEVKDRYLRFVEYCEKEMNEIYGKLVSDSKDFSYKKEATSAIRRFKPLGCSETCGFSMNLRTIRHVIAMRTNRHAEEIGRASCRERV